ncbi:hypothetical protein [Herbaspirillum robiniae]|uniref:hypothetical protein n=1 Tax=Herbaspirillum robiniae TaxID=2014887 RepID=UPI00131456F3|nr:hypothetical protein [Herbaspirillum robiniae]
MRIYAVYLLVIIGLLAASSAQAESMVPPPNEHFFDHFYRFMAMTFSHIGRAYF